jgi:hypothetical protein
MNNKSIYSMSYKIIIFLFIPLFVFAQEKRDLLISAYSKDFLEKALIKDISWVPYPGYTDREGWQRLPESMRQTFIEAGEKYLNYTWPTVRATEYLEFSRTGDRTSMEAPQGERMLALRSLTMAELSEGKGRFMDDLVNGVFSFCEQSYWGLSACFYMYGRGKSGWNAEFGETNLPDIDDPIIDLWVAEVAADLAWVWHFFHSEFDKISPVISRRLKSELQNKALYPFYERNDYWWITGWGKGRVNNWTPWCNYNMLTCIALIEEDPVKRTDAIYKTMTSIDLFFNVYNNDGGCDEGPSYWGVAGGKAFDYLSLLSHMTNGEISLFDKPIVKEIGRYIYRAYIGNGMHFTNFADAAARMSPRAGVIYRFGEQIGDSTMIRFGAYLLSRTAASSARSDKPYEANPNTEMSTLGTMFDNCFLLEGWQESPKSEPLLSDYYFPDVQVAIARNQGGSNKGFYFAAKGGHNGEQHNHNDVGSCIVFYDGNPVLIDAGVGTYTRETFSGERYKIWTMQSTYHNLPLINGVPQSPGVKFKATRPEYKSSAAAVSFSADIAGAYPEEAQVETWIRGYRLKRNKSLTVSDKFRLKETNGNTELHFITPLEIRPVQPGLLELSGGGVALQVRYDASLLSFRSERIVLSDPRLVDVWGDHLSMMVFDVVKKKSGHSLIEIVPVNRQK